MEFSEPISAGGAYYFAICFSDINIKFDYRPNAPFANLDTYTTFNDALCAPTNIKILGNYYFNTNNSGQEINLLGISSVTSQSAFSNIFVNISATVINGHIRRYAALVNDHIMEASVFNVTLAGEIKSVHSSGTADAS